METKHAPRLFLALALALLAGCAGTPVAETPPPSTPAPAPIVDTACPATRPEMCTMEYNPVCATRDTGIRCITAPCPSSERKTYSTACTACADHQVSGWTKGACPGG
jgi:hypothetical protein